MIFALFYFLSLSAPAKEPTCTVAQKLAFTLVESIDREGGKYFTQGLVYQDGFLYEGTGLYGQSGLFALSTQTKQYRTITNLAPRFFGEGITILDGKIYQLTWKEQIGFVYELRSGKKVREFTYSTEGWGLTHNHKDLILSNGTDTIQFLEPGTGKLIRHLRVKGLQLAPFQNQALNELEFAQGGIFANLWYSDLIVKIHPESGCVTHYLNLQSLRSKLPAKQDVLNGIAYDGQTETFWVTGKKWPKIFRFKVIN